MKKKILNLINKVFQFHKFQRQFDDLKLQNGINFSHNLTNRLNSIKSLDETYFKVFSQNFEDGIIDYLLQSLKIKKIRFVEIGTQDYSESNTRFLFEKNSSEGLIIDGYPNLKTEISKILKIWRGNLKIHNHYIDSENILEVLTKFSFDKNVDLFSLDIDGIDYWILKKINPKFSKIIIAEYNPFFGSDFEITVPNLKDFDRKKYHYSHLCYGMSLRALINLMKKKDYTFLGTNELLNNGFFIANEYLNNISLEKIDTKDLTEFTNAKYMDSRDKFGQLNYINTSKIIDEIENCEIVDISDDEKIKKIKDLI